MMHAAKKKIFARMDYWLIPETVKRKNNGKGVKVSYPLLPYSEWLGSHLH
jgi:hypothetical protein